MKFTIATSVALLLPFAIAQSSGSAGASTDAVSAQQYQPGAGADGANGVDGANGANGADGADGATPDASTAYGGLGGAGANNATSNSTAALGDASGAGAGSASFDPSATSEDSSTSDADATGEYPSTSSGAIPPAVPASDGASGSGSGGSMDYMKTAQDVPAAGSPSGGSMGGGMDQATTGDDNKQLVVSDRRFEENGNRRIELKIEFGESHVYQTWEIRDGKLEEVPGGTGGTAMPSSKSGASAASGSTSYETMSKSQSSGASGSTQDGASSVSGFDDLTGGSPSPSAHQNHCHDTHNVFLLLPRPRPQHRHKNPHHHPHEHLPSRLPNPLPPLHAPPLLFPRPACSPAIPHPLLPHHIPLPSFLLLKNLPHPYQPTPDLLRRSTHPSRRNGRHRLHRAGRLAHYTKTLYPTPRRPLDPILISPPHPSYISPSCQFPASVKYPSLPVSSALRRTFRTVLLESTAVGDGIDVGYSFCGGMVDGEDEVEEI